VKRRFLRATKQEADASKLTPMAMLVVLLTKQIDGEIEEANLADLVAELIEHYGSVENAIAALENRRFIVEKIP
jgi:hypothetical protein